MTLTATILRLSEDIDLTTGDMAHFVLLQLPNGRHVRALINEEAAQEIVNLTVQTRPTPVAIPEVSPGDVVGPAVLPEPPSPFDAHVGVPAATHNGATHVLLDEDTAGQI